MNCECEMKTKEESRLNHNRLMWFIYGWTCGVFGTIIGFALFG